MSAKPVYVPGKLKFKDSKKKTKRTVDETIAAGNSEVVDTKVAEPIKKSSEEIIDDLDHLTPAQKRHELKKRKLEGKLSKEVIEGSYRERVEKFNYKLSTMTEHNDIPRISAAGNG